MLHYVPAGGAWNAAQVLEAVSRLVVIMSNIRGLKVQNEERDCSFKDFKGHHFLTFNGSFSSMEAEKLAK